MMRETSRAARPTNTDAQREAVLALFAREPRQPSRQAVSEKTGIPEKTICWRVRELIAAGTLKELDAVDGKHPLELVDHAPQRTFPQPGTGIAHAPGRSLNAAGRTPCYSEATPCGDLTRQSAPPAGNKRTGEDVGEREYRVPAQSAPAASRKPRLVAVRPTLFGRMSLSLDAANKIAGDKGNAFLAEAQAVIANGGPFWVWG